MSTIDIHVKDLLDRGIDAEYLDLGTAELGTNTTYQLESSNIAAGIAGPKGDKGDKGDPFTYENFTPELIEALRGPLGILGERGYTPQKGIDYYTELDINDIKKSIEGSLDLAEYIKIEDLEHKLYLYNFVIGNRLFIDGKLSEDKKTLYLTDPDIVSINDDKLTIIDKYGDIEN